MSPNVTDATITMTLHTNVSTIISESGYDDIMNAAFFINKYYLWFIMITGFPGNLATIVTILRMQSFGSFTLYIVLLAFVDNLAILVKTVIYQLFVNKVNFTTAGCRIMIFLGNFLATFANWILVLMAVERLVAVRYPLKIKNYFNCRRSSIAICTVGAIIVCAYAPILWVFFFNEELRLCDLNRDIYSEELLIILSWTNVLMFTFIPFIILALCNLLIVLAIKKSFGQQYSRRNSRNSELTRRSSHYLLIQRQIMVMLFTTTLVFVLFVFPLCAFQVADSRWKVKSRTRGYAIKYLVNQVAFFMCDSNHAVNFYVYFLSSKKFRSNFLSMITRAPNSGRPITLINGYLKRSIHI